MKIEWTKGGARIRSGLLLVLSAAFFVPTALAVVPGSDRVAAAAAKANRADQRTSALRFMLNMQRVGEADPIATGELVTHPRGFARLELRAPGRVERHLLLTGEHRVARNGLPVPEPRAFLPPLFLLQAGSASLLNTAMEISGVEHDYIGLAPCGEDDCYVIGDPEIAVNGPAPLPGTGSSVSSRANEAPEAPSRGWGFRAADREKLNESESSENANEFASIWIGTEDFEIKQVRMPGGVRIEFGPLARFGKLTVPSWWIITEVDKRPMRFDVLEVSVVNAPAGAFTESWILASTQPGDDSAADAGEPAASSDGAIPPTP